MLVRGFGDLCAPSATNNERIPRHVLEDVLERIVICGDKIFSVLDRNEQWNMSANEDDGDNENDSTYALARLVKALEVHLGSLSTTVEVETSKGSMTSLTAYLSDCFDDGTFCDSK